MVNVGLAMRTVGRSTTVRAMVLAALALAAINTTQASGSGGCTVPNPVTSKVLSPESYIYGIECEEDYDAATAGGLVEMVALSAGYCHANTISGHGAQIADSDEQGVPALPVSPPTSVNISTGQIIAEEVACAGGSGQRQGRSYYVPKGKFASDQSNTAKAGNFRSTGDNYLDAYHCGGWQDSDCSHKTYVTNSRGQTPGCPSIPCDYEAGGGGLGQFGTSWPHHDFRPYCRSSFWPHTATLRCASFWYADH